jgi:hypothetical protein
LETLAETGNVRLACKTADVSRATAYVHYHSNPSFADRWDDALEDSADLMEQEARRRAVQGTQKPVIYKGELAGNWVDDNGNIVSPENPEARLIPLTVREYSDTLLMFMLKGARPEKYRDNYDLGKLANELAAARATSPKPPTDKPKGGRKNGGR